MVYAKYTIERYRKKTKDSKCILFQIQ